jgi:ferredoxin-NADP reductase
MSDPRQAAIERAVRAASLALLSRGVGITEALAMVATAMGGTKKAEMLQTTNI